MTIIESVV